MIDQFTLQDFEKFLESQKPYEALGIIDGEYCYKITLDGQSAIMLRSSIGPNGKAKESGKDSIRLWLVGNDDKPLGSKIDAGTKRTKNWQKTLADKIFHYRTLRFNAGDCPECNKPFRVFKLKGKDWRDINNWFAKCNPCSARTKRHVNGNLNSEGWFSQASQMDDVTGVIKHERVSTLPTPIERQNEMAYLGSPQSKAVVRLGKNQTELDDSNSGINKRGDTNLGRHGSSMQELSQEIDFDEFLNDPFDNNEPEAVKPKSNLPTCPKCNGTMILRSGSHFDDFWGCRKYPKCKGAVSIPKEKVKLPYFPPSKYQAKIYDFVDNGNGHGRVDGVAGCGKTYTNVMALGLVPKSAKTKYVTFGNRNQKDIAKKAPDHVSVTTFHVMGQANIYNAYPKAKRDKWKAHNITDDVLRGGDKDLKADIIKLVGLLKGAMLEPTEINILDLANDFNVELKENEAGIVRQVFLKSVRDKTTFDFNDMIYWPAKGIVPTEKFDYIFIDEFQDMDMAQYIMSKKSLRDDGRMLAIGDPNQSIYQFRGAHDGIMDFMSTDLNATRLSLPVSYRAPLAVANHVNKYYPHIRFEAAESAINGRVDWILGDRWIDKLDQKSVVLCRTNAPLVEPCFSLIRRGIKAVILGRDIGTGLIKLIEKRQKMKRVNGLYDLLEQVQVYCNNEVRKALKQKKMTRVAFLEDQAETIFALSADCRTIQDLKDKCASTFSDKENGITFSSIHKAKGLEWQRVFVIGPKNNHPMGDEAQETNIRYVRDTRALDELYFVEE